MHWVYRLHWFEVGLHGAASEWLWQQVKVQSHLKDFKTSRPIKLHLKSMQPLSLEEVPWVCKPELVSMNKENELITSSRHANKFFLTNAILTFRAPLVTQSNSIYRLFPTFRCFVNEQSCTCIVAIIFPMITCVFQISVIM